MATKRADAANTDVVIYHNPQCGTSRNVLAAIRAAGIEPHVIEYLKCPPSSEMLLRLTKRMGVPLVAILREKGTPLRELGLDKPGVDDATILAAVEKHPALIQRPIVVTPKGVKLCRPSETVAELLPAADR